MSLERASRLQKPTLFPISLLLSHAGKQDASAQLLLQHYACLPATMLPTHGDQKLPTEIVASSQLNASFYKLLCLLCSAGTWH